jgi:hypothetical protein
MALHHHFSSSHVDDDDVVDDDDDDQHHSYILNIYGWHAHVSHVFFLLNLSEWVIIVGNRTYVWKFVYGTADFLYAWLHRRSICLCIFRYFFFQKELVRISGYSQREWILCRNINKNKSRWKSIDTYLAICLLFVIILSVKERSFCLFYSLKSIISLSCLLLRTSIKKIIESKRSRNHVV